jgi:hypothetical protein
MQVGLHACDYDAGGNYAVRYTARLALKQIYD